MSKGYSSRLLGALDAWSSCMKSSQKICKALAVSGRDQPTSSLRASRGRPTQQHARALYYTRLHSFTVETLVIIAPPTCREESAVFRREPACYSPWISQHVERAWNSIEHSEGRRRNVGQDRLHCTLVSASHTSLWSFAHEQTVSASTSSWAKASTLGQGDPCSGHHESWAVALNLERTRLS